jgi:hypothetical protein
VSTDKECVQLVEFLLKYPLDEILAATSIAAFHEADRMRGAGFPETASSLEKLAEVLGNVYVPEPRSLAQ